MLAKPAARLLEAYEERDPGDDRKGDRQGYTAASFGPAQTGAATGRPGLGCIGAVSGDLSGWRRAASIRRG
jgi:hypothetical protein